MRTHILDDFQMIHPLGGQNSMQINANQCKISIFPVSNFRYTDQFNLKKKNLKNRASLSNCDRYNGI